MAATWAVQPCCLAGGTRTVPCSRAAQAPHAALLRRGCSMRSGGAASQAAPHRRARPRRHRCAACAAAAPHPPTVQRPAGLRQRGRQVAGAPGLSRVLPGGELAALNVASCAQERWHRSVPGRRQRSLSQTVQHRPRAMWQRTGGAARPGSLHAACERGGAGRGHAAAVRRLGRRTASAPHRS